MYNCLKLIDPVMRCPYNENHLIARSRLQKHIVKCERNYPKDYKIMCPFNATHRLFKVELEEHIITCPARNASESEMYIEPKKCGALNFALHSDISDTIDSTENWDSEFDFNSVAFTDDESSANDKESFKSIDNSTKIRAPLGFSEAMLTEVDDKSCIEDAESVVSSMGVGRGKTIWENNKLKLIGLGRGCSINTDL